MTLNRAGRVGPLLAMLVPVAGASDHQSVTATPVQFDTVMAVDEMFQLTCSVASYIVQGAAPVASPDDGSMHVAANEPILIDGAQGAKLSIVRATADGVATLQQMAILE